MEAFADAVGLVASSFGLGTVDVLNGQAELVFAVLAGVTVFGASTVNTCSSMISWAPKNGTTRSSSKSAATRALLQSQTDYYGLHFQTNAK